MSIVDIETPKTQKELDNVGFNLDVYTNGNIIGKIFITIDNYTGSEGNGYIRLYLVYSDNKVKSYYENYGTGTKYIYNGIKKDYLYGTRFNYDLSIGENIKLKKQPKLYGLSSLEPYISKMMFMLNHGQAGIDYYVHHEK